MPISIQRAWLTGLLVFATSGPLLAQAEFQAADSNSDNRLSPSELRDYVAQRTSLFNKYAELFAGLDWDKDGFLSREEFDSRLTVLQTIMDSGQQTQQAADVEEFVDRYNRMFAGRDPRVGQLLPNATGYDEQGNPFELHETRGNYTVIVSGCLT